MRIIVTGGAGFIGSALVRYIINETNHSVINIDKVTYSGNLDSLSKINNSKRYHHEKIDICDKKSITKVFLKYQPTCIMHLAAETHVDKSIDSPSAFVKTNIIGTYTLLETSRAYFNNLSINNKNFFRFHHISTDEVYGDLKDKKLLFTESSSYDPSSPYSASKASSDHLVRAWGRTYGLPIIITNCSNNYGSYQFPEKLIPHIILNAINGKPLPIYGDGLQIRDWLYVDDHVEALIKVLKNSKPGKTYNIGGHNEKTNIEVVRSICDLLEEFMPIKPNGIHKYSNLITFVKDRPGHDTRYAIDSSKIQNDFDWIPKETFETGLRKTVKWYIDNEQWWQRLLKKEYKLSRQGGL